MLSRFPVSRIVGIPTQNLMKSYLVFYFFLASRCFLYIACRVGIRNLVLRKSVPHIPLNFSDMRCDKRCSAQCFVQLPEQKNDNNYFSTRVVQYRSSQYDKNTTIIDIDSKNRTSLYLLNMMQCGQYLVLLLPLSDAVSRIACL